MLRNVLTLGIGNNFIIHCSNKYVIYIFSRNKQEIKRFQVKGVGKGRRHRRQKCRQNRVFDKSPQKKVSTENFVEKSENSDDGNKK